MSELKNCPFCGGEAEVRVHHMYEHGKLYSPETAKKEYYVQCLGCATQCGAIEHETEAEAVAAWNRRADDWRPASEPPETNAGERPKSVMVCAVHPDGRARLHTGWCMEGRWYVPWVPVEAVVTHWRHLPEPPKEDDDAQN